MSTSLLQNVDSRLRRQVLIQIALISIAFVLLGYFNYKSLFGLNWVKICQIFVATVATFILQFLPNFLQWVTRKNLNLYRFFYWPLLFAITISFITMLLGIEGVALSLFGVSWLTAIVATVTDFWSTLIFGSGMLLSVVAVLLFNGQVIDIDLQANMVMVGVMNIFFASLAYMVRASKNQLKTERQKSEALLLNILPPKIAEELKKNGSARPVRVEAATVLFTDFIGFTRIAERLSAEQVVEELDKCFSYFDQVTGRYNLEKLKTIGDSFMCAGGLPDPNKTHAIDCALAALEIQGFMLQMKEIKEQQGLEYWQLRLGINTGPLVAGIVGEKKFAYDVWGDTVITASRIESAGSAGKINLSATTYTAISSLFDCTHRGKVEIKNKAAADMYFLNQIKAEVSENGAGRVPNNRFKKMYAELQQS